MTFGKISNVLMLILVGMTLGSAFTIKFYDLEGLWGTRNALQHTARVAATACEKNAYTALNNDADRSDLAHCPTAPSIDKEIGPK